MGNFFSKLFQSSNPATMAANNKPTKEEIEARLNALPPGMTHKAAGVILVADIEGERHILLGEQRKKDEHWNSTLSTPSGKVAKASDDPDKFQLFIDEDDPRPRHEVEKHSPVDTAARELFEETAGKMADMTRIRDLIVQPTTVLIKNNSWQQFEKDPANAKDPYLVAMYGVLVKNQELITWVKSFNEDSRLRGETEDEKKGDHMAHTEMRAWYWVPLDGLFGDVPLGDEEAYKKTDFFREVFVGNQNHEVPFKLRNGESFPHIASYAARTIFLAAPALLALKA